MFLKVKKLRPDAILPTKAHVGDLGYDLYVAEDKEISAGSTGLVSTGIACEFPPGYGALIRDRSSVATKDNLFVVAGVIDNGYTGEIKVAIHHPMTSSTYGWKTIKAGTKIAQLILIPTVNFPVIEVSNVMSADERGAAGFGSTGR